MTHGTIVSYLHTEPPPPVGLIASLQANWKRDLLAGLVVANISTSFSMGIARASGFPPVAGLFTAIIAGVCMLFLRGSYVTVSGPAAGLALALATGMDELGRAAGNPSQGYGLLLATIVITGAIEMCIISRLKVAKYSERIPIAVVEGMLAAIGIGIIVKMMGDFFGQPFAGKMHFWDIIREIPTRAQKMNPSTFLLGLTSLILVFGLPRLTAKIPGLKLVPSPAIVVIFGIIAGRVLGLEKSYLIQIPQDILHHEIVRPNFSGLFSNVKILMIGLKTALILVAIDTVESAVSVRGIDKKDPCRRTSDVNRTLRSMGILNVFIATFFGGTTNLPGGIKSTANIQAGGRTLWAGFFNACFLAFFLVAGKNVISQIPLATLGAVVMYAGYALCKPAIWREMAHEGLESFATFLVTVFATLSTDLVIGIGCGCTAKLAFVALQKVQDRRTSPAANRAAA